MRTFASLHGIGASIVGAILFAGARPALAQDASDAAAAEALFDEGKSAMARRDYATACPKFFESNRLDEGIGTLLWLADCYEKSGQTASAWAEFRGAASLAVKTSDRREKVARARAQALESRLSRLILSVPPEAKLEGLHIARDGTDVAAALWDTPLPIDPGHHAVVVSAPEHRQVRLNIDIRPGPSVENLSIPVLEAAPGEVATAITAPALPALPAQTSGERGEGTTGMPLQRIAALGAGGVGIVSLVAAIYFGLHAKSQLDASNDGNCHANNECNAAGVSERSSASSAATASTALFIVGGAAIAGGAALWLLAPSRRHLATTLHPWTDPFARAGGVVLVADF